MTDHHKVIIIGSGPAGRTAAIYSSRAKLEPLLFEGEFAAGVAAGGQLTTTTEVENFPGFIEISGPELMMRMREQSEHCGAKILTQTVDNVDLSSRPFKVISNEILYTADALIIATGATAKRLGLKGEDTFWQKGMSACAVCDGGLPLFRNKPMVVIGGGDTAAEEATYLTKFASKVYLLVRSNTMRASKAMQERVLWNTEAVEVMGDTVLQQVKIINTQSNEEKLLDVNGLFYAIGHTPNTAFLDNQLQVDESGYIITSPGTAQTSVKGVFAAGDVQDKKYRQAITSAGSGCMAALEAEHFIATLA